MNSPTSTSTPKSLYDAAYMNTTDPSEMPFVGKAKDDVKRFTLVPRINKIDSIFGLVFRRSKRIAALVKRKRKRDEPLRRSARSISAIQHKPNYRV